MTEYTNLGHKGNMTKLICIYKTFSAFIRDHTLSPYTDLMI